MRQNRFPRTNDVIFVQNALVNEVLVDDGTAHITISYKIMNECDMEQKYVVVLIANRDTIIQDQFGQRMSVRNIRPGMIVDAAFSSAMTRSIPPQTTAFSITVIERNRYENIYVGRITKVDTRNNMFYAERHNDRNSLMKFVVTDATVILNEFGNRISFRQLRRGQMVRVEHASFMTMSIPPQTTAFEVQIL